MTRQELEIWALAMGYTKDRYGHFKRTNIEGKVLRIKMGKISARFERQASVRDYYTGKTVNAWFKYGGDYYKNLFVQEDGKISNK